MESRLYVGTTKGIVTLQSTDQVAWETESQGLGGWGVPCIATVPSSPNQVLAGTRGDGVWLSEDCGKSWRKPSYGKRGPGKVRSLAVDPNNPRRVYAGCEPIDIFVSEDLGASWERLASIDQVPQPPLVRYANLTAEPHIRDIKIDNSDSSTLYAAWKVNFIIKTMDGGKSWQLLNEGLDPDVHTVVVDPSNSAHIFTATGGLYTPTDQVKGRALYASVDGGASWEPCALNFPQDYAYRLVMNPGDPKILYSAVATGNPGAWQRRPTGAESELIRSRDGGESWDRMGDGWEGAGTDFPWAMAVDAQDSDHVILAGRSGNIAASSDGGDNWVSLDLQLSGVEDIALAHF